MRRFGTAGKLKIRPGLRQESLRTTGKSSLFNPVRFAQLAHEPALGTTRE